MDDYVTLIQTAGDLLLEVASSRGDYTAVNVAESGTVDVTFWVEANDEPPGELERA